MSFEKMGNKLPYENAQFFEAQICAAIARILRQEHKGVSSAVKRICARTGANPETVKRWYKGLNSPSSGHLIMLARQYPAIFTMFVDLVTHLAPIPGASEVHKITPAQENYENSKQAKNVSINVSINCPQSLTSTPNHNSRQEWFLEGLRQGSKLSARDICARYPGIEVRTAWRDIGALQESGLIRFVGAKRTGHYEICPQELPEIPT